MTAHFSNSSGSRNEFPIFHSTDVAENPSIKNLKPETKPTDPEMNPSKLIWSNTNLGKRENIKRYRFPGFQNLNFRNLSVELYLTQNPKDTLTTQSRLNFFRVVTLGI